MGLSGFSIIRNAVLMDYPIIESIKSILPLVDEFVIGVGHSEDKTRELILEIGDPKIKIFDSEWDKSKTNGGLILSEKTNEALQKCKHEWCFYLQADEVIHEQDLVAIDRNISKADSNPNIEGLLFNYLHFYGCYNTLATARNWYRKEIRIVRKSSGIKSYKDAQGFRVGNRKANVVSSGGRIFHYGWVKPPNQMGEKNKLLNRWWHGNNKDQEFDNFEYKRFFGLRKFNGSHPAVMLDRVSNQNWTFDRSMRWMDWNIKEINRFISHYFEKAFGYRIGEYKNYNLME